MKKKIFIIIILLIVLVGLYTFYIKNKNEYNVKIGDYIEYGVEYDNISTMIAYENEDEKLEYNGWRIIEINDGKIMLISSGTPCLYQLTENIKNDINNIKENFEETSFEFEDGTYKKGKIFKNDLANKVSILNFNELSQILNGTNEYKMTDNVSDMNENFVKYNENMKGLICNKTMFFIASEFEDGIVTVLPDGSLQGSYSSKAGIRPVVELKENIKIINGDGTKENPYKISL